MKAKERIEVDLRNEHEDYLRARDLLQEMTVAWAEDAEIPARLADAAETFLAETE